MLTVSQAAKELAVSIHGLRRWISERKVPVVRLGRRVLLKREDLEEFIEQNRVPALEEAGRKGGGALLRGCEDFAEGEKAALLEKLLRGPR